MAAWREFRRGKRTKPDVAVFEFNLEDNLFSLHHDYEPDQYTPFFVRDPKLRHIHKAPVRDRLVHQTVFRLLYPIFDPQFIFDSYSCRQGKGTHAGVRRLYLFARRLSQNYRRPIWALKCDIRKFFDSIDQTILLGLIRKKIIDARTLQLVTKIVESFETRPGKGLPLGNVTSQLFANIYLHELDWLVKHKLRQKFYLRYCDDFIILGCKREKLFSLVTIISDFLQKNLALVLHPHKITIRKLRQGIDFLGYVVRPHYVVLRTKTKRRILNKAPPANEPAFQAYLGVLRHCRSFELLRKICWARNTVD